MIATERISPMTQAIENIIGYLFLNLLIILGVGGSEELGITIAVLISYILKYMIRLYLDSLLRNLRVHLGNRY